jgi:hypothetical protein
MIASWLLVPILCFPQTKSHASPPLACQIDLLETANQAKAPVYAIRPGNAYCDGNAPKLLAGEIELVNLTIGKIQFSDRDPYFHVIRPPGASATEPLIIRGFDRRPLSTYRLDGSVGLAGLNIALGPAIHAVGLDARNLGLIVSVANPATEYLPILGDPLKSSEDLVASIKIGIPAVRVFETLCALPQGTCGKKELIREQIPEEETIDIAIHRLSSQQRFRLIVDVDAAFGAEYSRSYTVIAPGNRQ